MKFRNTSLATAVLLALGTNLTVIGTATAGSKCAQMQVGATGAHDDAQRSVTTVQPAMYWGNDRQPALIKTGMGATAATPGDIVDVAVGAGNFTTLVAAVKAAGLVETLQGEGPFTVFAPTDEAFAKIPEAQLEALLADKDALTAVLTYHVVPGKVMAADVAGLTSAATVQGSSITIDTSDGVKVDGANVVATDIAASNGIIHVIDAVILPN